jgi:hypothetical protein
MDDARTALLWAPRVLAILTALFLGAFALDAFGERHGFWATVAHFVVHLLPAILLLATVALAWHRAWIGALVFLAAAALYAGMNPGRPDWILTISGPLALVGLLYLASWLLPGAPRSAE